MENNRAQDFAEMEAEDFPDEFKCCVCLDIMYKPVVLACGHISCFWCAFEAMDVLQESHCPVCRRSYNHFPRICSLLHFLLMKLYPSAYKRKGKLVAEEEKKLGHASPQFVDNSINSQNEVLAVEDTSSPLLGVTKSSSTRRNSPCEDNVTAHRMTMSSQTTDEANFMVEHKETNGTIKQVHVSDLQCAVCKQLLFRPVVLNCGHVFCEACTKTPQDSACKCPVCQSPHPNGFPNVCLVLEQFLKEHFPEEYAARKESSGFVENASPSGNLTEKKEETAKSSSVPTDIYTSWLSGQGPKVHPGVGCDNCGMCPIIGDRYKCKDCVEKIGFDLCEGCYNSSSKLPGRFNQQHTPEHQFEVVAPIILRNLILSLGAENPNEHSVDLVSPDNHHILLTVPDSNDALDQELENMTSVNSSDDDGAPRDPHDHTAASPNNSSRDQGD